MFLAHLQIYLTYYFDVSSFHWQSLELLVSQYACHFGAKSNCISPCSAEELLNYVSTRKQSCWWDFQGLRHTEAMQPADWFFADLMVMSSLLGRRKKKNPSELNVDFRSGGRLSLQLVFYYFLCYIKWCIVFLTTLD